MKDQAKAPIIVVAVIAVVALLFFFGSKAMSAGDLDQGQEKYTPGKPPWADPLKQGRNNGRVPASPESAPPPPNGAPAGMSPPKIGG